jgi:hypothetical protein
MLPALALNPSWFRGWRERVRRNLGRSLEVLEASQARRHLFRSE